MRLEAGDVVFMLQLLQSGERSGIILCWCGNIMLVVVLDFVKVGFNFGFVVVLGTSFFLNWEFDNLMGKHLCFQNFGHINKGYLVEDENIFGKMQHKFLIKKKSFLFSKIGYVCLIQDNTLG
jgi:hypothetical protein